MGGREPFYIVLFGVLGASLGASVAVKVLNQQTDVRSALLVSPGRSYQGLDVTEDIKLREKQTLLVVVGTGDAESAEFARFIDQNTLAITQGGMERLKEYDTSAHGIDLVNEFMPKGLQKLITDYVIRNI